jgi:DNA-3-methyladenine glycosylase II
MHRLTFSIKPLPPFRLDLTAWALRRRSTNIVDRLQEGVYRRVLMLDGVPVEVAVCQRGPVETPRLMVSVISGHRASPTAIRRAIEVMLGTQIDLSAFYARAEEEDGKLGELVRRFRGVKPPRFPSIFEALVNAVAGQQVSMGAAVHFLNRLSQTYGGRIKLPDSVHYAFPRPSDLSDLREDELRLLGFSSRKSRTLIELSRNVVIGALDLDNVGHMSEERALLYLDEIPGIGRWSSEYVLLRGLGRTNIFPGDDVGARNGLKRLLNLKSDLDYEGVKQALVGWKGYGGLLYFHLRLNQLENSGYIRR